MISFGHYIFKITIIKVKCENGDLFTVYCYLAIPLVERLIAVCFAAIPDSVRIGKVFDERRPCDRLIFEKKTRIKTKSPNQLKSIQNNEGCKRLQNTVTSVTFNSNVNQIHTALPSCALYFYSVPDSLCGSLPCSPVPGVRCPVIRNSA